MKNKITKREVKNVTLLDLNILAHQDTHSHSDMNMQGQGHNHYGDLKRMDTTILEALSREKQGKKKLPYMRVREAMMKDTWKGKEKDRPNKDKSPKKGSEPFNGRNEKREPPTPKFF
ncbi:hypothetical protein CR513_03410, partial [Mucuna pruriens]